jgi:hypothetical protein
LHRQLGVLPLDSLCDAMPDRNLVAADSDDRNWLGTLKILGCYTELVLRCVFLGTTRTRE